MRDDFGQLHFISISWSVALTTSTFDAIEWPLSNGRSLHTERLKVQWEVDERRIVLKKGEFHPVFHNILNSNRSNRTSNFFRTILSHFWQLRFDLKIEKVFRLPVNSIKIKIIESTFRSRLETLFFTHSHRCVSFDHSNNKNKITLFFGCVIAYYTIVLRRKSAFCQIFTRFHPSKIGVCRTLIVMFYWWRRLLIVNCCCDELMVISCGSILATWLSCCSKWFFTSFFFLTLLPFVVISS